MEYDWLTALRPSEVNEIFYNMVCRNYGGNDFKAQQVPYGNSSEGTHWWLIIIYNEEDEKVIEIYAGITEEKIIYIQDRPLLAEEENYIEQYHAFINGDAVIVPIIQDERIIKK